MSRKVLIVTLILSVFASVLQAGTFKAATEKGVAGEYLVVFNEHAAKLSLNPGRADLPEARMVARRLARQYGVTVLKVWDRALTGMLVQASEGAARRLAGNPLVASVEQNAELGQIESAPAGSCYNLDSYPFGSLFYRTPPASSPQTLNCSDPDPTHDTGSNSTPPVCQDNWGLDVVDQHSLTRNSQYTYDRTGANVRIFFIDGGINAGHKEFLNAAGTASRASAIDVTGDTTCSPATDPLGHGTHVASIAAGRTFGVAKDATVVMIRASNCGGNTLQSWIVDALNVVAGQRPSVLNWSGGNDQTTVGWTAIRTALQGVVNSGVSVVQSAGNQSSPYVIPGTSPASYPTGVEDACNWTFGGIAGVIVAGGMDHGGNRWTRVISGDLATSFCPGDCGSNVGACIDVWAPASNILGAGRYDMYGYCRLSGTSMAAPHVAGAAALYLQAHPLALPAEVESAIKNNATTGLLNTNTGLPNHIGTTSPNKVLYTKIP